MFAELPTSVVTITAAAIGFIAAIVTQYVAQRATNKRERDARAEARRDRHDDYQRATLIELQDGPLTEVVSFMDAAVYLLREHKPDPADLVDALERFYRDKQAFFARLDRLRVRIADDTCRSHIRTLEQAIDVAVYSGCDPATFRDLWSAQSAVTERIGELLRTLR